MAERRRVHEPIVCGPPKAVYRVSKRGRGPFSPPPWTRELPEGTFGGRFDDPGRTLPAADRFRVVYVASTREAALDESIAQFRSSVTLLGELDPIEPPVLSAPGRGIVPASWRLTHQIAETEIDGTLRLVDISAHRALAFLRSALASVASAVDVVDIDRGAVAGPQRLLTQLCARRLYEVVSEDGEPRYAGIRSPSRLHASWECWAIFAGRLRQVPSLPRAVLADDPDLLAAAWHLGLSVEGSGGG